MPSSKKKFHFLIPVFLIFLTILISIVVVFFSLVQAVDSTDHSTTTFVIPKGQSTQLIAERLKKEGLIRSTLAFRLVIYQQDLQGKIQAGSFKLTPSLTTSELAQTLTRGTDDLWVVIPEGLRREEIAATFTKQDLKDFNEQEFLDLTMNFEGQLFPDTYLVPKSINTQAIVNFLQNTFENKVVSALADELNNSELSLEEILVLASLVQREGVIDEDEQYNDMPLIAGILFNRLEIDMPLQVDATLQYINGYNEIEQSWWSKPAAANKNLSSAYNTYQNPGLPPAPICNPGLVAIKAVLNPQATTAFYYVHDLAGQIYIAETLEAHNANVNRYLR